MLSLVLRRALGQYRLVAAVVALVTVAATLLGVCALLLGPTQDRAFDLRAAARPAAGHRRDFAIDAFLVRMRNDDIVDVRETAADQLREILGPLEPEVTAVQTSPMRDLVGTGDAAVGYFSAGDGIEPRSELLSGRWPQSTAGRPRRRCTRPRPGSSVSRSATSSAWAGPPGWTVCPTR